MRSSPFDFDFQFHWLTLVVYPAVEFGRQRDAITIVRDALNKYVKGISLEKSDCGAQGYENVERWQGVRLLYGGSAQNGTVCVSLSGDHVASMNLAEMREFIQELNCAGDRVKCTRLDLAFDVAQDELQMDQVYKAVKDEKYTSRVRRDHVSEFSQIHGEEKTIVFGSRQSSRYFRVYNQRGYVRFELELKGDAANLIGLQILDVSILANYSKVLAWAVGVLKDFINFDADFWKIFDGFERAGYKVSCFQADSMERSKKNIEKRMGPVIAALVSICGREWLEDQLYMAAFKAEDKVRSWGYAGQVSPVQDFCGVMSQF